MLAKGRQQEKVGGVMLAEGRRQIKEGNRVQKIPLCTSRAELYLLYYLLKPQSQAARSIEVPTRPVLIPTERETLPRKRHKPALPVLAIFYGGYVILVIGLFVAVLIVAGIKAALWWLGILHVGCALGILLLWWREVYHRR
jgi:hypothetical protein